MPRLPATPGVLLLAILGVVAPPCPADAQATASRPMVAASGRASTSVAFDGRVVGRIWLNRSTSHSGPALLVVDYGQPHARGRTVYGELVPFDEVWRLGANMATHLRADLDIRIGDLPVPQGLYTLYLVPRPDGAELIVNRSTGQWGTVYEAEHDLGRVSMRVRELPDPAESLILTLAPVFPQVEGDLPRGLVTITWGRLEYVAEWEVDWPTDP